MSKDGHALPGTILDVRMLFLCRVKHQQYSAAMKQQYLFTLFFSRVDYIFLSTTIRRSRGILSPEKHLGVCQLPSLLAPDWPTDFDLTANIDSTELQILYIIYYNGLGSHHGTIKDLCFPLIRASFDWSFETTHRK